jgi:hypothetical protein
MPADRVSIMRTAFMDMMNAPELVRFTRDKNIDFGPALDGAGLQALVEETLAMPQEVVALAKKARGD